MSLLKLVTFFLIDARFAFFINMSATCELYGYKNRPVRFLGHT